MLWSLLIVSVLVLSILVAALSWLGSGPILAIPLFLVVAVGGFATLAGGQSVLRTRRHHQRIRRFRENAKAQKQDFSPADRKTLI